MDLQHVLHGADEIGIRLRRDAPACLQPGLEAVFSAPPAPSRWRSRPRSPAPPACRRAASGSIVHALPEAPSRPAWSAWPLPCRPSGPHRPRAGHVPDAVAPSIPCRSTSSWSMIRSCSSSRTLWIFLPAALIACHLSAPPGPALPRPPGRSVARYCCRQYSGDRPSGETRIRCK